MTDLYETRRGLHLLQKLCHRLDTLMGRLQDLADRETALALELSQVRLERNDAETALLVAKELLKGLSGTAGATPEAPVTEAVDVVVPQGPDPLDTRPRCKECGAPFTPKVKRSGPRAQATCSLTCNATRRRRLIDAAHARTRQARRQGAAASGRVEAGESVSSAQRPVAETPGDRPSLPVRTPEQTAGASDPGQPPVVALPERRCSRCCHRYTPTHPKDYYCAGCHAKGGAQWRPFRRDDPNPVFPHATPSLGVS